MNTIKLILAESGQLCELKKDFPIYVGSYQNKLLNILVPTSIIAPNFIKHFKSGSLEGTYTATKVGMSYLKRDGSLQKTPDYYMNYLKNVTLNNVEYSLYERRLPKDFTLFEGQGQNAPKLIVNVVNVLIEDEKSVPKTIEIITSQATSIDVMYSSELNNEPEYNPTDMELISSKLNTLMEEFPQKPFKQESMRIYNVKEEFPEDINYNKNGYKSIGVLFTNEQFNIKPTLNGDPQNITGSIMATCIERTNEGVKQTELFYFKSGIAAREITFDDSLFISNIGEWHVQIRTKQNKEDASKFLYIDENGNISIKTMIIPENIDIIDSLDNNRDNASLAARQGKVLKEMINTVSKNFQDEDIIIRNLINNVANSLVNYYTKLEIYTKEEVNNLIGQIPKFKLEIVSSLPTTNISDSTVYLLKTSETETKNIYTEYVYVNNVWETLGTQKLDLSNYTTIEDVNKAINSVLSNYYTKIEIDTIIEETKQSSGTKIIWEVWKK